MDNRYVGEIYDVVKKLYEEGRIDIDLVRALVHENPMYIQVAHISPEQFEEITGEKY